MDTRREHYLLIFLFAFCTILAVACSATKKDPNAGESEVLKSSEPSAQKEVVVREVVVKEVTVKEEEKSSPLWIPVKIVTTTISATVKVLALTLGLLF